MTLRTIHLHGDLGARFGEKHVLSVETASEAVRALAVLHRDFRDTIIKGEYHIVRTPANGNLALNGVELDLDMVSNYRLGGGDLHIMPVIAGSKNSSGLIKIVLGVALVGAAFMFTGGALGAAIPLGSSGISISGGTMAMVGLAVAAAGVSSLLTPEEEDDKSTDSFLISGPGSTSQEGSAIPLVYGEVYTGGVVISAGMDAEDLLKDNDKDGDHDEDDE